LSLNFNEFSRKIRTRPPWGHQIYKVIIGANLSEKFLQKNTGLPDSLWQPGGPRIVIFYRRTPKLSAFRVNDHPQSGWLGFYRHRR